MIEQEIEMLEQKKSRGWKMVLGIVIPYIMIVGMFQFVAMLITGLDFYVIDYQFTTNQLLIITITNFLGTFFVIWVFMKFVDEISFVKLGLEFIQRGRDIYWGFIMGAIVMTVGLGLLLALGEIRYQTMIFDTMEIVSLVVIYLIVAVVEETLFRGYVLRNLMISFNKYIALSISAVLFALLHGYNPNIDILSLVNLFLAGGLLGVSYIYTKNLWFPIALHFSWNFFQSLLGFNVSGHDSFSVIEFSIPHHNLLNGGAFGFEGSVFSVTIQLFIIIAMVVYFERKTKNEE